MKSIDKILQVLRCGDNATEREIVDMSGLTPKQVVTLLGRLVKTGRVIRRDGLPCTWALAGKPGPSDVWKPVPAVVDLRPGEKTHVVDGHHRMMPLIMGTAALGDGLLSALYRELSFHEKRAARIKTWIAELQEGQ